MGRMMDGAVAVAAVGAAVYPSHTRAASMFVELVVESGLLAGVAGVDEDSMGLPQGDLLQGEVKFLLRRFIAGFRGTITAAFCWVLAVAGGMVGGGAGRALGVSGGVDVVDLDTRRARKVVKRVRA